MKMQEVITKLREEAPLLDKCAKDVDSHFERATGLARDLEYATSDDGRKLLRNELAKAMTDFGYAYRQLRCSIETVCLMNREYKEKLGPRAKKPKDDPRQMDLFDACATTGDTSATSRKCPRCKASATGCEFLDNGVCTGIVYPTNPPQYDPCVFV